MKYIYSLILILLFGTLEAQTPDAFSFQAVARGVDGSLLVSSEIEISAAITTDANAQTVVYSESHVTTTNAYGIFSIQIGGGTSPSGSLSSLDWANGEKYLAIRFRPAGGEFSDLTIQQLVSVPFALYAKYAENIDDADADSTNELQTLAVNDSLLTISGGNTVNLSDLGDGFEANTDSQTLSLKENSLSITGGNEVDLSGVNTDNQELSLDGTQISIEDGNTIDIGGVDTDEQTLSLNEGTAVLSISNGNSVNLGILGADTDDQNLTLTGSDLSIDDGNTIDLSGFLDNSDSQTIDEFGLSGTNLQLSISGDGQPTESVDLATINTDNQTVDDFYLSDNILGISLSGDGESPVTVNVSALLDNTDTQDLALSGSSLSLTDGGSVNLSGFLDNTDEQSLALSGNTLSISGGNNVSLAAFSNQSLALNGVTNNLSLTNGGSVSLTPYLDNTDEQSLSLSGSTLSISGGNNVSLAAFSNQSLALNGVTNNLSLTNGGSVSLTPYLDNTDEQSLSLSGSTLSISGGNNVSLAAFSNQSLALNGVTNNLSLTNGGSVSLTPYLDNTDTQDLALSGNSLSLTNGGSVNLAGYLDNTDTQDLNLSGNSLSLTNGGSVDLAGYLDNTDDQQVNTFTINSDQLGISLENDGVPVQTVDLTPYLDNTDNQSLGYNSATDVITLTNSGSIDISEVNTDNQTLGYNTATDVITLTNGGSVDITEVNTDDQRIDLLQLSGSTLRISLEGDGQTPRTVDLSSLASGAGSYFLAQFNSEYDLPNLALEGTSFTQVNRLPFSKVVSDTQSEYDPDSQFFIPTSDGLFQLQWSFQMTSREGTVGYYFIIQKIDGSGSSIAYMSQSKALSANELATETGTLAVEMVAGNRLAVYLLQTGSQITLTSENYPGTIDGDGNFVGDVTNFVNPSANFLQIVQLY